MQLDWLRVHPPQPKEKSLPKASRNGDKKSPGQAKKSKKRPAGLETEVDEEMDLHGMALDEAADEVSSVIFVVIK